MRRPGTSIRDIPDLRPTAGTGMSSMRRGETAPTVGAMNDRPPRASVPSRPSPGRWRSSSRPCSSPTWDDDPAAAIRVVAESGVWTGGRLLDLDRRLPDGRCADRRRAHSPEAAGSEWARAGQPFLILMGALGAGAIVTGASDEGRGGGVGGRGTGREGSPTSPSFDTTASATEPCSSVRSWPWACTSPPSRPRS